MLILGTNDTLLGKADGGTVDVIVNLSGTRVANDLTTSTNANVLQPLTTTSASIIAGAAAQNLYIPSIVINNVSVNQRTITLYLDRADATPESDATTLFYTCTLMAGEMAMYGPNGWTIYDSNGIPKFSSAVFPRFVKGAAPGNAPVGSFWLYGDASGLLHQKDEYGIDITLPESGMRDQNLVINGNFDYAQRQLLPGTLATYSNTTGRTYGADRWGLTNENASCQYIRTDAAGTQQAGLQARFFGTFSKITTTGKFFVSQVIAGADCQHLRGKTVRLQFKLKASAAKTIRVLLLQNVNAATLDTIAATFISAFGANSTDPTFGTNLAKIAPVVADNATIANTGLSCSVTTAWQRFGATFVLPTDYKNLVIVVGTDSQFAAADSFSISEAGLYDGPEIREWAERMQAQQLANCQRFYDKSCEPDVGPAQNMGVVGAITGIAGKAGAVALAGKIMVQFHVPMLKPPTVTIYCPTEASAQIDRIDGTTPIAHTATAQLHLSSQSVYVTSTGTTNTGVGDTIALHYSADAEI